MERKLPFVFLLFVNFFVLAQETYVPDNNFEAFLEANGMGNGVSNDDYVTTANISSVTTLNLSLQMIAYITGIEDFAALESLDITFNGVGNIDVSNNTNLKTLNCSLNGASSIDVSGAVNLETLNCSNNSITDLDVSSNTKLKSLRASSNTMRTITLGTIDAIEELIINANDLTSLNLSSLANLMNLNCENNSNLDITDFSSLTSLAYLNCNNTSLSSLNLSNSALLETLTINGVPGFDLDLSLNTALVNFSASSSDLTSLNIQNGNNSNITSFNASGNEFSCIQVDDANASYLSSWQKHNGVSFEEDCSTTSIPDINFEYHLENHDADGNIVAVGSPNSMGNGIIDDGKVLTTRIENVTYLDISENSIRNTSGIEVFEKLEVLDASENNFTEIDLSNLTELKELYLNDMLVTLGSLDVSNNTKIEKLIFNNANATTLTLGNNNIIKELNIGGNNITSLDISAYTALEIVNIADNDDILPINVRPLINLKELNANDTGIQSLDLSQNTLLETLSINGSSDFYLDLSNNPVLTSLSNRNSDISSINIQNGNNANVTLFDTENGSLLGCVEVDDPTASYLITWNTDNGVVFSLDCSEINVPDNNFENYLETHDADGDVVPLGDSTSMGNGTANDNKVYSFRIKDVTSLDVSALNIGELIGLEGFESLEILDCSENNFNEFDFSQLPELKELYIHDLFFAVLNLSSNLKIEKLIYNDANSTSLSLGNNTVIKELDISNNNIGSLDVSLYPTLEVLNISNNPQLFRIDVRPLTNLKYLNANNNGLFNLDVRQNLQLETLFIDYASGFYLDLSNNTALTSFSANTSDLNSLNMKNGNNTNITFFDARLNQFSCIEVDDPSAAYLSTWQKDNHVSFAVDCRETSVPNDNFENYLETHDADGNVVAVGDAASMGNGISNDNVVYTYRIENVIELDISGLNISDATGIEDFVALQNLNCFNNSLSSIDLSQNVALQILAIGRNNLTSLDLSQNTALTFISCIRNQITSLDVSQNTMLESLYCSNNQINNLNVANNPVLKNLSCYSNSLGSLDVTNLPLLENLDCVDNDLTSLDLSKNVLIEDVSCASNQLTYLNLRNGNNTNFNNNNFDIRNNPGLTCVSVDDVTYADTNFTRKDVQTEFKLFCAETYVPDDVFENYLETHNTIGGTVPVGDPTSLGNGIADDDYVGTEKIQNLAGLSLSNFGITDFTGIEDFVNLERLIINGNQTSSLDLTSNTKLEETDFVGMELNTINITGLSSLKTLELRDNNLSTIDVSSNVALERLNLDLNNFSSVDISANTALIDFRIRENSISTLDLSSNINLKSLYVDDNSLSTLDVSNNTLIETLRCGGNQFTAIDIGLLTNLDSFSIEDTPTLIILDVTNNTNLEDIDVSNTALSVLDITNQTNLVELYTNNTAISALDFSTSLNIEYVECQNGQLTSLNFKNGANNSGMEVYATGNPNLVCIQVDDPTASYLSSNWEKDATAGFSDDCNWTYVPDDNFENYLETHDADNNFVSVGDPNSMGNGIANDDYVKTANIQNVTSLFIAFQGVTDLTGLEYFAAVETLFIFSNTLTDTNLDLTSNTNLTRIDGADMGLTSIDIAGLTSLERMDVSRNDLATIDLSTNTALKDLIISSNNLTGLDVSNNLLLEDLQIHETTLSTIDLRSNVNLTRILASLNQFTSFNTQNNTLLETLNLSRNPLSSYDVSHLLNLQDLSFDETNITYIDISQNTNLVELSARDIDELAELNARNGNNSNFTEFRVTGCPNLSCIEVDDPTAGYLSGWEKDATASFAEYCRFTTIPDVNFEAYLETHNEFGGTVALGSANSLGNGIIDDNLVPTGKIEAIQLLTPRNEGIQDFTGIEDFTNLIRLWIDENSLTNTDLDLTNNTLLQSVTLESMGLTSLDVTGLTVLLEIEAENNNLTTIDISTNSSLTRLNIADNDITNLDISNNDLETLWVTNNRLGTLDVSGQPNLKNLYCENTNITSLNIENNPLLVNLECGVNPLTTLNVTHLTDLFYLSFSTTSISEIDLSTNVNLSRLECDSTPLTYLDLVKQNTLDNLSCKNALLTGLNLRSGNNADLDNVDVTGNPSLTCIEVDDPSAPVVASWLKDAGASYAEFCRMTYVPDDAFETFLENNGYGNGVIDDYVYTALVEVSIGFNLHNGLVSDMTGIEDFRDMWFLGCRNNTNLTSIDLSKNTKLTVITLADNNLASLDLSNNVLLEQVYLDSNANLGDVDISALRALTNLSVSNTGIDSIDISNNPLLRQLILNDNNFTELDISAYPNVIQLRIANNQLTSINIANGNNDNFTWFDALGNPDLTCIKADKVVQLYPDIWQKDDTASFALYCDLTYIADANFENYLETHDIDGNIVAIGDAASLGNGIANDNQVYTEKIQAVVTLDVSSLDITDLTGIEGFAALESLNVDYNDLLALDVSYNTNLRILDAAENDLISVDLSNNIALEEVNLRSNNITSLLVDNNPNLKELRVGKNQLTTLDVTSCIQLEIFAAHQNLLASLDVRNGNNNLITDFFVLYNPNLTCIQVDDASASYLSSWEKDDIANFNEDCVAPVITLEGGNPQEIELGSGYTELGATADDGSMVSVDSSDFVDAVGQYTIRYNATDGSGNMAVEVTRTVNVVDTTAPLITLTGANLQEIELGSGYTELGATTDDGSVVSIDASDFVDAVGQYTIRYNATDASGNMAIEVTRMVNVVDTVAPVITLNGANPQEIELGSGYIELGATTDDGSVVSIDSSDFVDAVGQYTIRYNATDGSGNMAVEVTRTVNVVDTTAPLITLTGANLQEIELGSGYTELGATTDDGSVVSIDASDFVDAVGQYTIRYNATDASGNMAIEVTRMVNVVDTVAPVITLNGANPQEIELGSGYIELGATTDDGSVVSIDSSDFVDAVGQYTIGYNATDASGNMAIEVTRTVNVVDTTAPVITLNGADPQEIELGSGYAELGATTDDGSVVSIDSSDFVDAVGQYTIRYNATDASGNMAIEVTRMVNVVDIAAPVITLNGANPQEIELGSGYTELGATTDDGSIVSIDASDFVDAVGQYTIRYNATDVSGNMAMEVIRIINVVDTTAPVINLNGANPQEIELGAGYTELGATTDDGSIVNIDASDFVDAVGQYTIRYNATDASGNMAIEVTRIVRVVPLLDIPDQELSEVFMVPNPADYQFEISGLKLQETSIYIFDFSGKLVKQVKEYIGGMIDVRDLSSGAYFVKLDIPNSKTYKLIKN